MSKLPRLRSSLPVVDDAGRPDNGFIRFWNEFAAAIEGQLGALAAAQLAQTAADAANAAAGVANAAAVAAQGVADAVEASSALANSYTTGLTITATDAGANATITISAHTRVYGDGTSVAVTGGPVTGLAYATDYWLFYDQASRAGGAVTYAAATTVQGNGTAANRHFIGAVRTPAAAGGPVDGNPVLPPGGVLP